ncbi:MAG: 2-iminobutanoate/2-iminopropanoate deaminase [Candidatus Woesearchaeota archaeon]|nr:2-iminobutanoate/2-iminopropanoate deaminase [Candidatus Woesearchaeota archaeon]
MKHIKTGDFPFSKAVICKNQVELSGQIGLKHGKLVEGIQAQTKQAMENVIEILKQAGLEIKNLTKVRIYLTDMSNYSIVNKIYAEYFEDKYPARVAIGVKELPLGALIELDCSASGNN